MIILGLLFGYGYISLKKKKQNGKCKWNSIVSSRRRTEWHEFKAREEGQNSSSSSSYDEGSDDAYSGDYDEDRYDNDESYRDGVDDMLDELGE